MAAKGARAKLRPVPQGPTTEIPVLANAIVRPGALPVTPGNASNVTTALTIHTETAGQTCRLFADKSYGADYLRTDLREKGINPVISAKRGR